MKNFNKKIIAFLFALSVSLTSLPLGIYAASQTQTKWTEDDFTWDKSENITVTGLSDKGKAKLEVSEKKKIVIPKTANAIGAKAFFKVGLNEVAIHNSVTTIGISAFEGNKLTHLKLPVSIRFINDRAFVNNMFTKIVLPKSLERLGICAFAHNKITSLTINSPYLTEISAMAFAGNNLKEVNIPNTINVIKTDAFKGNQLTKITIQDINKTKIENFAFNDQSIEYHPIELPFSLDFYGINGKFVEGIDINGFASTYYGAKNATLKKVGDKYNIDSSETFLTSEFNFSDGNTYNGKIKIYNPSVTNLDDFEYSSRDYFTWDKQDSSILTGLSSLGEDKFRGKTHIKIKIPEGTTVIEHNALENDDISEVILPHSLKSIKERAFLNNELTKITIPNSVTEIGSEAFSDNKLTQVTIPNSVTTLRESAFQRNNIVELKLSNSLKSIPYRAFYKNKIQKVDIPSSISVIGKESFKENSIEQLSIPNSVIEVSGSAFYGNKLTTVTIPDSVIKIGEYAFANNKLKTAKLPNGISELSSNLFDNNELTKITIPRSVVKIGEYAFYNNKLDEVTIPDRVTSINRNAFFKNHIRRITILSTDIDIKEYAFGGQDFRYEPSTYPFEFKGIGISQLISGEMVGISDRGFYGFKTTSLDGSTQIYSVSATKWRIASFSPGIPEFDFDTNDKYHYSGCIYIDINRSLEKEEPEDKPTNVKIIKVGKDDTTKQLEGAEFEIIEVEEEKEE